MEAKKRNPAQINTVPVIAPTAVDDGVGLGGSPAGVQDRDYGAHVGLLDTAEPYAGQGVRIPEEVMFGAQARQGWDGAQDAKLRTVGMQLQAQTYALREQNRELLIELGTIVGHEGYDWQNPYVWTARGIFPYPSENSTEIASGIGGAGMGQTPQDVLLNVQATGHALLV